MRIAIERPRDGGPPWSYAGAVHEPHASHAVRVVVAENGDVTVDLAESAPRDLEEKVRLIVRTVYRQAKNDGEAGRVPPRRIVRWRGDK